MLDILNPLFQKGAPAIDKCTYIMVKVSVDSGE